MNWKVINKTLGAGNAYAPDQPAFWWVPLAAAGISAIGNMWGQSQQSGFTKEQQRLQSRLNREEQADSMQLQKDYQNMVWDTGTSKQVSGMKNAGLNPAMAGGAGAAGGSGSFAAHPTSGASGPSASGGTDFGSQVTAAAMDGLRLENETNVANAQAEALEAQAEKDRKAAGLTQKETDVFDEKWNQAKKESDSVIKRNEAASAADYSRSSLYKQQKLTEEERVKTERENQRYVRNAAESQRQLAENYRQDSINKKVDRWKVAKELQLAYKRYNLDVDGFTWKQKTDIKKLEYDYIDCWSRYITAETAAERTYWEGELARVEFHLQDHYGHDDRRIGIFRKFIGAGADIIMDVFMTRMGLKAATGVASAGYKAIKKK